MKICIAGKNNIAVECLLYSLNFYQKNEVCVILNKSDNFKNSWQKSLGFHAKKLGISILSLNEVMNIEGIIFFSIEFDLIIKPENFKTNQLFNIHFSKLPEYKGMFTSILPILHEKKQSGVTLHVIDRGIDTGDVIDQIIFEINGLTSRNLYEKLLILGTDLFKKNFQNICSKNYETLQQPALGSTYYSKKTINFNDVEINVNQTASQISIFVNAYNFRVYQTAKYKGKSIIKTHILNSKSTLKPGTLLEDNNYSITIATIDFDIILFYDFYDFFIECCKLDLISDANNIINYIQDINETNVNGWSPIIVAAYFGSINVLKLLISNGVNINSTNLNGTSLLMYSCSNFLNHRNVEIIEYLLTMGANVHLKDIHGLTIFDYCSNIELINLLNKYK